MQSREDRPRIKVLNKPGIVTFSPVPRSAPYLMAATAGSAAEVNKRGRAKGPPNWTAQGTTA